MLELTGDFQTTDCQEGQHLDPSDPNGSAYELRWEKGTHSRRNCASVDQEHDDPIEHDVRPARHHGQINRTARRRGWAHGNSLMPDASSLLAEQIHTECDSDPNVYYIARDPVGNQWVLSRRILELYVKEEAVSK